MSSCRPKDVASGFSCRREQFSAVSVCRWHFVCAGCREASLGAACLGKHRINQLAFSVRSRGGSERRRVVSGHGCSSSCVLQEVSAALCFTAPVPTAEQRLLRLLGLFFPHLWKKGFLLPVHSLTGEVRVLLSLQILTVSPLLLAPGSLGKTTRAPQVRRGVAMSERGVMSHRSLLTSAVGVLCSPVQLHLELRLFAAICFPA